MSTTSPSRVTLHEVAQAAGASIATVSNALRGGGRISLKRREQIRRLAMEMGYQPQTAAQLLRTAKTGRLAIVITEPDPVYAIRWTGFGGLMAAVVKQCQQLGIPYDLDFCPTGEHENAFVLPEHLAGGFADGALVIGWMGPLLLDWFEKPQREPWVQLTDPSHYCVLNDDAAVVHQAADHLASLGHRRIAFTHGPLVYEVYRSRRQAFDEVIRKHSFEVDPSRWIYTFNPGTSTAKHNLGERMDQIVHWALSILSSPRRPTAVIFSTDLEARAIIEAARRLALDVPEQLSLAGYGDELNAYRCHPPLTTVGRDLDELARQSVGLLLDRIAGRDVEPGTRWVQPILVVRDSTAPVPVDTSS